MYKYDTDFYRYINKGAIASANVILPELLQRLPHKVTSVIDVGCGAGAWLSVWKTLGSAVTGVDGDYINTDALLIAPEEFVAADLKNGFSIDGDFDLAQCLEVAEHLPENAAEKLVASLCNHAELVLFSAAPPGQGGENHINEQIYSYWRELFKRQGFQMCDPLRRGVVGNNAIEPWYRYNLFVYFRASNTRYQETFKDCLVNEDDEPEDISPATYRMRKWVIRTALTPQLMTLVAKAKKNLINLGR